MTRHASVLVIGGGIVGCSILYHLAKAGCRDAVLLERNELTSGATWHAAGNVHTQSAFPNLSALQAYSLRLYDGLAEEVGQEVGSHVVGGFFLAQTPERMEEFKFLAGKFRALGLDYELVGPGEIKAKHPLIRTEDLAGGAWDPEEGYVDPSSVTLGLAAGARKYGATLHRGVRVSAIERAPAGASAAWRIHAETPDGAQIWEADILVNAAGFWADPVARMMGARLPITNMEHHYLVTEGMPGVRAAQSALGELPMIRDTDSGFYLRQEADGLLFGPWETDCRQAWGGAQPPWTFGMELFENDLGRMEAELAAVFHRVPDLESAGVKRVVNGAISFAPDARPVIGPLPDLPGAFVACGFLGGVAQAGGIGLALSQWILDGAPELDLSFIDVARFGDWTTRDFAARRTHEVFPRRYEIIYPGLEREQGRNLRRTPVTERLKARGAVFGQAFGWERPLWFAPEGVAARDDPSFRRPNWFAPVGAECRALAEGVGLIEMSSYAKFRIEGPDAAAFLDRIGSAKVPSRDGKMALTLLLNPDTPTGCGVLGDLTLARLGPDRFYAVGATAAETLYRRWFDRHRAGDDVRIETVSGAIGAIGVAGPQARALLERVSPDDLSPAAFPFMCAREIEIGAARVLALRVSYSGELGWELHAPMDRLLAVYDALVAQGGDLDRARLDRARLDLAHVGARALSQLRLEKGYRSWGHELTQEITPAVAGLERFCSRKKTYLGRAGVDRERAAPPPKRLATLIVDADGADCWGSEPIFADDRLVGIVTSGGYGWRVGRSLAVGWLDAAHAIPGTDLAVQILQERRPARVVADPLYDPDNTRLLS